MTATILGQSLFNKRRYGNAPSAHVGRRFRVGGQTPEDSSAGLPSDYNQEHIHSREHREQGVKKNLDGETVLLIFASMYKLNNSNPYLNFNYN